jgi:2-hydroxychromene-2-carboxylate isomerase
MTKTIDYYLSLISPWTYLGSARLEEIARSRGAQVRVKPVDYGVIFPETGGLPLAKRAPARQAYRLVELRRWSQALGLPLNLNPKYFPAAEQLAACTVLAAAEPAGAPLRLAHAILRAVWVEERNIADAATLEAIADATGHSGINLMARACEPETLESYKALTEEALERDVFGAPSYVYEGELFWGQDRLDMLDRALAEG